MDVHPASRAHATKPTPSQHDKTREVLKPLAWFAAGALLLLAASVWVGGAVFEASDVERGSWRYRLGAPDYLQAVQPEGECRAPRYRWKGRDGESSPYTSVSFGSRTPPGELLQSYRHAFERQACAAKPGVQANHLALDCRNADFVSVGITVSGAEACRDITIDFAENY